MSLQSRQEFLETIRIKYQKSRFTEKSKILDGFISATGYGRKYAIGILNAKSSSIKARPVIRGRRAIYGEDVKNALFTIWHAANQICSKRLIPFLPELIEVLERNGHLSLPTEIKQQLLTISTSTMDRLLSKERQNNPKSISTTAPGSLLKHQIKVKTFADWNDIRPGFFECDLVAHCGGSLDGSFLNTLTMVDVASGWLELVALLYKSSAHIIAGMKLVSTVIPFPLLGVDTDNGSEFINYELLRYCEEHQLTFTRSRAYRKNDQAHVEEKNGSVVRRVVGYERYEGEAAYQALIKLYSVLRLYINFFQPSLKLIAKTREGSKTIKKYDTARTPFQRLIQSDLLSEQSKIKLQQKYLALDPVHLLEKVTEYQKEFFTFAGVRPNEVKLPPKLIGIKINLEDKCQPITTADSHELSTQISQPKRCSSNIKKPRKKLPLRTYRTRKDPFADVWDSISVKLSLNPHQTSKMILIELIEKSPETYNLSMLRTLARRVEDWRRQHLEFERLERLSNLNESDQNNDYLISAIISK